MAFIFRYSCGSAWNSDHIGFFYEFDTENIQCFARSIDAFNGNLKDQFDNTLRSLIKDFSVDDLDKTESTYNKDEYLLEKVVDENGDPHWIFVRELSECTNHVPGVDLYDLKNINIVDVPISIDIDTDMNATINIGDEQILTHRNGVALFETISILKNPTNLLTLAYRHFMSVGLFDDFKVVVDLSCTDEYYTTEEFSKLCLDGFKCATAFMKSGEIITDVFTVKDGILLDDDGAIYTNVNVEFIQFQKDHYLNFNSHATLL